MRATSKSQWLLARALDHSAFDNDGFGTTTGAGGHPTTEKKCMDTTTKSIGVMIAMVNLTGYMEFWDILDEELMPYVEMRVLGLHFRPHQAYR